MWQSQGLRIPPGSPKYSFSTAKTRRAAEQAGLGSRACLEPPAPFPSAEPLHEAPSSRTLLAIDKLGFDAPANGSGREELRNARPRVGGERACGTSRKASGRV